LTNVSGIVAIAVYIVVMLGIGVWAMRKTRSVGDFFLGGRTIGPWMSAFAYGTTYFSAVLFIGYAGKLGWGYGLNTMWIVAGNVLLGSLVAWWMLGKRTREMTFRLNAMTMPAFLAERYKSPALKVAAALLIFIFLVPYSAGVYKGLNFLFQEGLGISELHAMLLLAGLTGLYLVMGGYFAVTLSDFIMGLMMIFGVVAMLGTLTGNAGGLINTTRLIAQGEATAPFMKAIMPGGIPGWLLLASLVVITSIGPWGLPQMVQKFYSIKNSAQIKRAMIVATLFALVITFGGYYTGALTHLDIPKAGTTVEAGAPIGYTSATELPVVTGPDGAPVLNEAGKPTVVWDRWMPVYLAQRLPNWIMTVIVLLVMSASMSTLSSLILVSSSSIAMDLYAGVLKPAVERKSVLVMMRVMCGVFVALSLYLALKSPAQIITLMVISWSVLAGAFAAPYIYGLFWKRANAAGAAAGLVSGVAIAAVLAWVLGDPGITPSDPGVPVGGAVAILAPFIIVPVVTLITRAMPKEHVDKVFAKDTE